jgi:hypothetical protein
MGVHVAREVTGEGIMLGLGWRRLLLIARLLARLRARRRQKI